MCTFTLCVSWDCKMQRNREKTSAKNVFHFTHCLLSNYLLLCLFLCWPIWLYLVESNTWAPWTLKNNIFLNISFRDPAYQLHFQRSCFPYPLRKAFCCSVTKLQAFPKGSTSPDGAAAASVTNQPPFLRPTRTHSNILPSFGNLGLKPHFR